MQKIIFTEELEELATKIINISLNYKKLVTALNLPILGGSSKRSQIKELKVYFKIEIQRKPTRYTIKEIYKTPLRKISPHSKPENKQEVLDFCKRRHLTLLEEIPDDYCKSYPITYYCNFHPDNIITTTFRGLQNLIGCPLCKYPMSRFEVMVFLGMKNKGALHRSRLNGVEYDIFLPNEKILIEIDGYLYHANDDINGRAEKKYGIAEELGYTLIKIIEQPQKSKIYQENNNLYVVPYLTASIKERKEIHRLLEKYLPYTHSDDLWDKAADYMRDWKAKRIEKTSKSIKQYNKDGELICEYKNFEEIKEKILTGNAFGYNWTFN